jgi:hypothetical protein
MRGLLKLLVVAGVLTALYYLRDYWDGRQVEQASLPFVTEAVNTATAQWREADFRKFQDPYQNVFLVNGLQSASLRDNLPLYGRLGKRTTPAACVMQNYTTYKGEREDYVAANYLCRADFENADAAIIVSVRRFTSGGAWKMSYFDVYTSYLANQKNAAKESANPTPSRKQESPWNRYRNMLPSIPSFSGSRFSF